MTIDEAIYIIEHHEPNDTDNAYDIGEAFSIATGTMRKYQMMQADYSAKLTEDIVAMLKDLKLELEELPDAEFYKINEYGNLIGCITYPAISKDALEVLQGKIDAMDSTHIQLHGPEEIIKEIRTARERLYLKAPTTYRNGLEPYYEGVDDMWQAVEDLFGY